MNIQVAFQDRQFRDFAVPSSLSFRVKSYKKAARFGARSAVIDVAGDEAAVLQLLNWIRYAVKITAVQGARGRNLWNGFIAEVEITIGAMKIGVSIDRMANRVAVAYMVNAADGSQRATTAWSQNDASVAEYGYLELLHGMNDSSSEQATAVRDRLLKALYLPVKTWNGFGEKSGNRATATITCRGWVDFLDARYFSAASEKTKIAYTAEPEDQTLSVGSTTANTKHAQGFTFTAAAALHNVIGHRQKITKVGNPVDQLIFEVCADSAGVPGAVLATIALSGANVPTAHSWVENVVESAARLTPSTPYHLQVRRSGAVDAVNFYRVTTNTAAGYAGGVARTWNGSAWVVVAPAADMLFELTLSSVKQTTDQIADMYSAAAQYLTGIVIEKASGVYSSPYRSGDQKALKLIEDILDADTSDGKRLTATVTEDRRLIISAEPEPGERDLYFTRDGRLVTLLDQPIQKYDCAVGVWAVLRDTVVGGDFRLFIDSAEYMADSDQYRPTARDQRSFVDILRPRKG
jgi:hypothetical protein